LTLVFGRAKVTAGGLTSKKMTADFSDIEPFGDKTSKIQKIMPPGLLKYLEIRH